MSVIQRYGEQDILLQLWAVYLAVYLEIYLDFNVPYIDPRIQKLLKSQITN